MLAVFDVGKINFNRLENCGRKVLWEKLLKMVRRARK